MLKFVARRLVSTTVMLIGLVLGTFVLTHVVAADPARVAAGRQATAQQVAAVRHQLGLDKPLWTQLLVFVKHILHGDFGQSFVNQRPVWTDIVEFFPATLELVFFAMVMMLIIGVPIGLYSALGHNATMQNAVKVLTYGVMGVPAFVIALLAQIIFFGRLGWFPADGRVSGYGPPIVTHIFTLDAILTGNFGMLPSILWHLALPATSLALYRAGMVARFMESQTLRVLETDYIRTARAKGLPSRRVITRHVLRNAAVPVLMITSMEFGFLLGGDILVEAIYSWPGMGSYILTSVSGFDFDPVITCVLVLGAAYALINLVVDIVQMWIDPRIATS